MRSLPPQNGDPEARNTTDAGDENAKERDADDRAG
jgi:hypothetical protein